MTKRQRLEKIIIGTLLDYNSHYEVCRCSVTKDMFSDKVLERIYTLIQQMHNDGFEFTDPYSIYERYGDEVADIVGEMCALCQEYSFEIMKVRHNERLWLAHHIYGTAQVHVDVSFEFYVSEFVKEVFKDEKGKTRAAADVAATHAA